jgi:hypothetical protein
MALVDSVMLAMEEMKKARKAIVIIVKALYQSWASRPDQPRL